MYRRHIQTGSYYEGQSQIARFCTFFEDKKATRQLKNTAVQSLPTKLGVLPEKLLPPGNEAA